MINFSKPEPTKVEDIVSEIEKLPISDDIVDGGLEQLGKEVALKLLAVVKENGATINLRVNSAPRYNARQIEVQVFGRKL